MRLDQLAVAGGFGLLGAALIVNTAGIKPVAHIAFGPALFPGLVGWIMIVLSVVAAFGAVRARTAQPPAADEPTRRGAKAHGLVLFAAFTAAPLVYVAVAPTLGFLVTMTLLVGGLSFLGSGKLLRSVALGVGLTLLIHLVFSEALRVTLPWGVLTDYAGVLTWR